MSPSEYSASQAFADIGQAQVLTLGIGPGNQQGQVMVALLVHRQQAQGQARSGSSASMTIRSDAENRLQTSAKAAL